VGAVLSGRRRHQRGDERVMVKTVRAKVYTYKKMGKNHHGQGLHKEDVKIAQTIDRQSLGGGQIW